MFFIVLDVCHWLLNYRDSREQTDKQSKLVNCVPDLSERMYY